CCLTWFRLSPCVIVKYRHQIGRFPGPARPKHIVSSGCRVPLLPRRLIPDPPPLPQARPEGHVSHGGDQVKPTRWWWACTSSRPPLRSSSRLSPASKPSVSFPTS